MTDFNASDAFHSLDKNQALITQTLEGMIQRLDRQDARMDRHAKDIEALKERRWPANTTSIVMMVVGIAGFVFTMVKGILWRGGQILQLSEGTRLITIRGMGLKFVAL